MRQSIALLFLAAASILFTEVNCGQPLSLQDEPDFLPWHSPNADDNRIHEQTLALPTSVRPIHYKINLRPVLEVESFITFGNEIITVHCIEATSRISLHSRGITINHSLNRVWNVDTGAELVVVGQEEDNTNWIYTILLAAPLTAGSTYDVHIDFISPILESPLAGLYRGSYVNPETQATHYLASTQFQADDARRAFPCFDEPGIRSVFEISLGRHTTFNTLCNMDLNRTTDDPDLNDWVWDHYNPTVVMPVYLIAIIVSDFDFEAAPPSEMNGKISKVWAAPHMLANDAGVYGAVTSARVILAFEEIFQAKFDLPKLDSAGIPQFSAGAMENWGLVTYRENLILYENATNTEPERRSVSSVIAHELAHQWFGNLVTCSTWADTWLNEGFATFVSYLGMEATDPEYEPLEWIVPGAYQSAMEFDVGTTSEPIHNAGSRPSRIIYDKAGAVIRMMSKFLGETTFLNGIRKYLNRHAYQSVEQEFLFTALTEQAHEDGALPAEVTMKTIMDTWTHQSGFPLLRVTRLSSTHVSFTQESFGPNPRKINTNFLNATDFWYVPFWIQMETSGISAPVWMTKTSTFMTYGPIDTTKWILVNPDVGGYYRVLYDNYMANSLQKQLVENMNSIPATSRSQLIDDYFKFAFATANYTTIGKALDWTVYMDKETQLVSWLAFFNNMGTPYNYFSAHQAFSFFKIYFKEKISGALTLIGHEQSPTDKGNIVILRSRLLDWDCGFGNDICKSYATKLHEAWMAEPEMNPVPSDLRPVMYCAIVANGGQDGLDFAITKHQAAPTATEKTRWLNAVGCATEKSEVDRVLDMTIVDTPGVTKAESLEILRRIAMSPEGRPSVMTFIQDKFAELTAFHGEQGFPSVLSTLGGYLSEEADLATLQTFVDTHLDDLEGVIVSIRNSLAAIGRNTAWMNSYGRDITAWLMEIKN